MRSTKVLKYLVPLSVLSLLLCLSPTASAEVLKLENSQALLLVSDSNSPDSDAASVSLIEAGLVDPNSALTIDAAPLPQ